MAQKTIIPFEEAAKMTLDECIAYSMKKGDGTTKVKIEMDTDFDMSIPNSSSSQWRLTDPNRPVGQPPLVPSTARPKNYGNIYKKKNRRYFNAPYSDRDKPNNNLAVNGIHRQNSNPRQRAINQAALRNLMNNSQALVPSGNSLVKVSNGIFTKNKMANVVDMMNLIMAKWTPNAQHKPKYDMNVQKEICEMQGKTLYFTTTTGGENTVITRDGEGIEDFTVQPTTTEKSLHQRFT